MNTHAEKTQENKSQKISVADSQLKSRVDSTSQFVDNRPVIITQRKLQVMANNSIQTKQATQLQIIANNCSSERKSIQRKENNTGLPDNLKTGIENLSGYSMDHVKVHRNSDKPAQLQAHAYAQGTDIHLAPGQEKHLPHEAWHVVQQKQGRVKPTLQMKGKVNVNDDVSLEKEADAMGAIALQAKSLDSKAPLTTVSASGEAVLQAAFSQTPLPNLKDSHHGGVHSQYDTANNVIEIHIDAGANDNGTLMQDFLTALWEARDTITAGQVRAPGGVFMRPGGAQVLKMTMEMLGESIGGGQDLLAAHNAKRVRNEANEEATAGNDVLDHRLAPEHLSYRNSMVGVAGISMNPIGGGTSGGIQDMLANNPAAQNERALYDTAINGLRPFLSIAVNINLVVVNQVIGMMEGKVGFFKLLYLKAKYAKNG